MQTCKQRGCAFESNGKLEFCPVCNNPIDIAADFITDSVGTDNSGESDDDPGLDPEHTE